MEKSAKQYYEELTNFDNTIDYMDGLFSLLVNNEITPEKLVDIMYEDLLNGNKYFKHLTKKNFFDWKAEFLSFDCKDQREYFQHKNTVYKVLPSGYRYFEYESFNNNYFYYQVERARKSPIFTQKLLKYMNDVAPYGCCISLKFLFMKWLKYLNFESFLGLSWEYNSAVQKFYRATGRKYTSLYDLVTHVYLQSSGLEKKIIMKNANVDELFNNLCNELKKEDILGLDLNDVDIHFWLMIESLLNLDTLVNNKNVANALRIDFCIIDKNCYRDCDYNIDKSYLYIKRIRDKVLENKIIVKSINEYYRKNRDVIDSQPNGYSVMYNVLFNLSDEELNTLNGVNNEI